MAKSKAKGSGARGKATAKTNPRFGSPTWRKKYNLKGARKKR